MPAQCNRSGCYSAYAPERATSWLAARELHQVLDCLLDSQG